MNMISPALEDNLDPPFKLFIHTRDFDPGLKILDNIQNAIVSSNSGLFGHVPGICQQYLVQRRI